MEKVWILLIDHELYHGLTSWEVYSVWDDKEGAEIEKRELNEIGSKYYLHDIEIQEANVKHYIRGEM